MTRKIDKRACRKFAIPELEFNLNEGILHVERCPYIIRTAVHNISGQRILVLYIYQSENILAGSIKPRWVMFHSRDDFATLSFRENAKATWQCSTLDSLDRIGGFDSKCAFYRQQDEARVARFCKCERGAISVLGYLGISSSFTFRLLYECIVLILPLMFVMPSTEINNPKINNIKLSMLSS